MVFIHPIQFGVLLIWRYFRWFSRFFVNFKSTTKFNTNELALFSRPLILTHANISKDLYIFSNFIPVLTKNMLIFANKCKIQFKGIKSQTFLDSLYCILVSIAFSPLETTKFNTRKNFKLLYTLNFIPMKHSFRM